MPRTRVAGGHSYGSIEDGKMEEQLREILMQHHRALALAAAGLIFLLAANHAFRRLFFQAVTTILLIAGILISYALITDHPATLELQGKTSASLAMAEESGRHVSGDRRPHAIR